MSKYRNQRTTEQGKSFHSKKEAAYYRDLLIARFARDEAQRVVEIHVQPVFPIVVNGITCGKYIADFQVRYASGRTEVVDVKSPATAKIALYRLKKKLVEALYGIAILEV